MKSLTIAILACLLLPYPTLTAANKSAAPTGTYSLVVEGFDWGAAVNRVILTLNDTTSSVNAGDYIVFASRKSAAGEIPKDQAAGERVVIFAYVSNENGERATTGKNITLVLAVGPNMPIGSPIQYFRGKGNVWVDYQMSIVNKASQQVWANATATIRPLVDEFDLTGKYKHNEKLTMSYASYAPKTRNTKSPLIIWLHGGGEGGVDPTIPLLGNLATNYAAPEIQSIFDGAYVLVPQCPGAWMHNSQAPDRGSAQPAANAPQAAGVSPSCGFGCFPESRMRRLVPLQLAPTRHASVSSQRAHAAPRQRAQTQVSFARVR
jgi:hypothetical protein